MPLSANILLGYKEGSLLFNYPWSYTVSITWLSLFSSRLQCVCNQSFYWEKLGEKTDAKIDFDSGVENCKN